MEFVVVFVWSGLLLVGLRDHAHAIRRSPVPNVLNGFGFVAAIMMVLITTLVPTTKCSPPGRILWIIGSCEMSIYFVLHLLLKDKPYCPRMPKA